MINLVTEIWPFKLSKLSIGSNVQRRTMNLHKLEKLHTYLQERFEKEALCELQQ